MRSSGHLLRRAAVVTNDAEVEIELSGAFVTWNAEELTAKRNEGLERDPRYTWSDGSHVTALCHHSEPDLCGSVG